MYLKRIDRVSNEMYSLRSDFSRFTHFSPPSTVHRPPSAVHRPPSTVHRPPSTVHRPPSTVHRPPSTVHRPPSSGVVAVIQSCPVSRWTVVAVAAAIFVSAPVAGSPLRSRRPSRRLYGNVRPTAAPLPIYLPAACPPRCLCLCPLTSL